MYNHNKAQQSSNRVHISCDILYLHRSLLCICVNLPRIQHQPEASTAEIRPWQFVSVVTLRSKAAKAQNSQPTLYSSGAIEATTFDTNIEPIYYATVCSRYLSVIISIVAPIRHPPMTCLQAGCLWCVVGSSYGLSSTTRYGTRSFCLACKTFNMNMCIYVYFLYRYSVCLCPKWGVT